MLQLLNPIALLAGAAVIIPVLVHLWNVRKGKTLRVGSIALLTVSARKRSSRLRINNWPLFLLRCLLLLLLALLLAGPVWNKSPQAGAPGWVLIPQQQLRTAYAQYKPQIDSLLAAGLELHNLSPGFEHLQLRDSLQPIGIADGCMPSDDMDESMISRWSLLKVLDARLPKAFPLHVFVNNRFPAYHGQRPETQLTLHWHSFSSGDSIVQTPALSYITTDGKINLVDRVSTPQGNYYQAKKDGAILTSAIDTSIIRVTIYPGKYIADAQYIKAAIQAIGQFTGRRIDLTTLSAGQFPAVDQQLIFRLDEFAITGRGQPKFTPANNLLTYIAPKGILFQYDTGTATPTSSWWQPGTSISGEGISHKVYQYTNGPVQGTPVWTLANGAPLLTVMEQEGKLVYHYKGRFHPAWSDLVWEDAFVKTLLPLVMPASVQDTLPDLRVIDDRQVKPGRRIQNTEDRIQKTGDRIQHTEYRRQNTVSSMSNLSNMLWMIVFIVFVAERIMVYRQQQRTANA